MATVGVTLACQSTPPWPGGTLLRSGERLEVLTEERLLALPPAVSPNRFLSGWWPRRGAGGVELLPAAPAQLEMVTLEPRLRGLILDLAPPAGGTLRLAFAGSEVAAAELAAAGGVVELPLPASLPLGRVVLELLHQVTAGAELAIRGALVRDSLPAGTARVEGEELVQTGSSLVELVREIPPDGRLHGELAGEAPFAADQRFAAEVRGAEGALLARFDWPDASASGTSRRSGELPRRFELNAGGTDPPASPAARNNGSPDEVRQLVTIRLLALGEGPAARWRLTSAPPRAQTPPADARGSPPIRLAALEEDIPEVGDEPPKRVVVVVLDAWRADHAGFGSAAEDRVASSELLTPALDGLAANALVAAAHAAVAPNTLPSTKALFTGQVWRENGGWQLDPAGPPTLAERYRAAGYRTGLFSGNVYVAAEWGMDRGFDFTNREVLIEGYSAKQPPAFNDNARRVVGAALDWLAEVPPTTPAFAYLHAICPHNPYDPPEPWRSRFLDQAAQGSTIDGSTETLLAIKQGQRDVSPSDIARIRGLYAGAVASCDADLAPLLEALRRADPSGQNTVLAVTSDHGEELFEHGGVLHGYTLYEEMLRIPLLLWAPGRVAPGRLTMPTTTLDLNATLLALLAAEPAAGDLSGDVGRDLRSLATASALGDSALRYAAASSVKGGIYAARGERFKVILAPRTGIGWGQGEGRGRSRDGESVFDLVVDPGETRNLAGTLDPAARTTRLGLLSWIEHGLLAGQAGSEVAPDAAAQARLRALGYLD